MKELKDRPLQIFYFIFIVGYICLNVLVMHAYIPWVRLDILPDTIESYDHITFINCSSDSMGLMYRCNDLVKLKDYEGEPLIEGDVYVYQMGNTSVIHRLVKCVDSDCNLSVFKGDNNAGGEFVNKSDIIYSVTGVAYYR